MASLDDIIFADLDSSFLEHPVKRELSRKTNEAAVKMAMRNLVLTRFYERPFQSNLGCALHGLFELAAPSTQRAIEDSIKTCIENFEKRVHLHGVRAIPDPDNNSYHIVIEFSLLNSPNISTLPITLERVR